MLERKIEKLVCDYAKMKGILCFKFVSPGNAGVPDRMFILPSGKVFFIEFKQEGKKPTPLQLRMLHKLESHACVTHVCDSVSGGIDFIDKMLNFSC
jgi:hypothetical protein